MKRIFTLLSALMISGIGYSQTYISEDFSTFTMPVQPPLASGWKNIDSLNNPASDSIWRFDNPGNHPTTTPFSGNFAIVDSDFYGQGNSQDCYLTTPNFDASTATVVLLEFDHYYQAIGGGFGEIQVFDGIAWVTDTTFVATTTNPTHEVIDISALVSGVSNAQVRFRYFATWGWQWAIDNVTIFQPTPDDASVVSVDSTVAGCGLGMETISATVTNAGSTVINGFPISYSINGAAAVIETVTDTLQPGDSIVFSFATQANFSTAGTYNIDVYTSLRGDVNAVNDSASGVSVHKVTINSYPYTEDFESGNGGWIPDGVASTWELGTPAASVINSAANGLNSYVTSLTGNYNNGEASFVLGPCFDFTSLNQPQFKMNVWWNSEFSWDGALLQMSTDNGLTWNKVGDFQDPNNWYNDNTINGLTNVGLSGEGWSGRASSNNGSGGWVLAEHDLTGAANQPSVQLRIFFGSDGSVQDEGFAFDDILIQDAPAADAGVAAIVGPGDNCDFSTTDSVRVAVTNYGSAPISNFPVSYEFLGGTPVTETVAASINPGDTIIYTFTTGTVNVSAPGSYGIIAYTDLAMDGNILNDTAAGTVTNNLVTAPFTENFDAFALGTTLINGWTSFTSNVGPFGSYLWQVNSGQTGSGGTGPNGDNTTGLTNYIYTEASNGGAGDFTSLTSPCIDVSSFTGARVEFWYHMLGNEINTLYVELQNANGTFFIDSIVGAQQTAVADPFLKRSIDITPYLGSGNISITFSSFSLGCCAGDISIDDFRVFEPTPSDVSMIEITAPVSNCALSSADPISVLITNVGTAAIDTVPVAYTINQGIPVIDTSFVTMQPGDTIPFTFTATGNFGTPGSYSIDAYTDVANDGDRNADTASTIVSKDLFTAPYTENFDSYTPGTGFNNAGSVLGNGWVADPDGTNAEFFWGARNSATNSGGTGPDVDHTTGFGNFVYVEGSNGGNGDVAQLTSPCIDMTGLVAPRLEFWYHKFGNNMGDLIIDIFDGTSWINGVDSVIGETQFANADPYLLKTVSLVAYAGNTIQVRFRSGPKTGFATDMAIDDVRIFEPSPNDASIAEVIVPQTGCGLTSDSIRVIITNAGTAVLNSVPVAYEVNGGTPVTDISNTPLNPGDSVLFTFGTTVNFAVAGDYDIVAYSDLVMDGDRNNDTTAASLTSVPTVSFPYVENFETSNGGWVVEGANPTWQWGAPASSPINTAGQGLNSWVTNLTGQYNNSENSFLVSPCIDLSGQTNDPTLTFLQTFITESCCDEGWVDMSLDGGLTWNKLVDNGSARNWYNDTGNQWWDGSNASGAGVYDTVSNVLTGAAGNANVRIRFAFSSDGSVTEQGFAIDSINIDISTSIASVDHDDALKFAVYPNPNEGVFTLVAPESNKSINVEILDTKGQLVFNTILKSNSVRNNTIDLSNNAKGVYFIKISDDNSSYVEKLVIK